MTPSRWPPSVVVGVLVAACQPAPVVRGPTTAVVEAAPDPEPAAETAVEAPERTASQCGEWPYDPDDPRVGIYVIDGELEEHDTHRVLAVVIFDGTTVVNWNPRASTYAAVRNGCEYSTPPQLLEYLRTGPPYRYPAQVDGDGWLVVFNPCVGWMPIGRFAGERLVGCWRSHRRLPFAAVDELMEVVREPLYFERLFRCYETYQPHRAPMPPMPPPPRSWHRDDCAQQ